MGTLKAFIKLGRPLFLLGGFVFHGLGLALAHFSGQTIEPGLALLGQLAITLTQLMTHFSNEYHDLAADRANKTPTFWAGGSRVLASAMLPPQAAANTANGLAVAAVSASLFLAWLNTSAPLSLPLVLLALLVGWQYSAPPLRLHWRGLGAPAAALIVPTLTITAGYYWQTGGFSRALFLLCLPLALLQAAMIITIDFPDQAGDAAAGKRTLVVVLGRARAAQLHLGLVTAVYVSLPLLWWIGLPASLLIASSFGAPVAFWLSWQLWQSGRNRPVNWNWLGFTAIALLMGTALAQIAVLLALRSV